MSIVLYNSKNTPIRIDIFLLIHIIPILVILSFFASNAMIINFQKTYAQSNNNLAGYNTFNDFNRGVSIQYPSNWIKNNTQDGISFTKFDSQETNAKNYYIVSFRLGIDNTTSSLDSKPIPSK